jgi:hypothetical protein
MSEIATDRMRCGWDRNITSLRGIKDAGDRRNRGTLGGPARRNARQHWDVRDFEPVSPIRFKFREYQRMWAKSRERWGSRTPTRMYVPERIRTAALTPPGS